MEYRETTPSTPIAPSKEGSSRRIQERIMVLLGLVFFGGILAHTFIPEPFNGAAMGLILFLTLVAMYRFN